MHPQSWRCSADVGTSLDHGDRVKTADANDFQHVYAMAAVVQRIVDESGDPTGFDAQA
jgi:hypothetical protein